MCSGRYITDTFTGKKVSNPPPNAQPPIPAHIHYALLLFSSCHAILQQRTPYCKGTVCHFARLHYTKFRSILPHYEAYTDSFCIHHHAGYLVKLLSPHLHRHLGTCTSCIPLANRACSECLLGCNGINNGPLHAVSRGHQTWHHVTTASLHR